MFCSHKWSDPVDRKQICKKCNKVIIVPCIHFWKQKEHLEISDSISDIVYAHEYILECAKCGELTSRKF